MQSIFLGLTNFETPEVARQSVARIDDLFQQLKDDSDGQHLCRVLALAAQCRAQWSGKPEQSQIFGAWLEAH